MDIPLCLRHDEYFRVGSKDKLAHCGHHRVGSACAGTIRISLCGRHGYLFEDTMDTSMSIIRIIDTYDCGG